MAGGKIDKRLGGIFRDKDSYTEGTGSITLSSTDGSVVITEEGDNRDLSVKRSYLELFASNESELLNAWTIGRASGKSFKINITDTITFTATRNFLIARDEPEAEIVGYPHNTFEFGNNRVNWSRVKIQNIDARTTHHTYFYAREGYLTLQNVRFIDDLLYNATLANMRVHVRSYDPANNNTGNIVLDDISHYTQNVTWNNSGDVQPLIIVNEGTLYNNLYVSLTKVDTVQSFERFSRLLLKATVSTPFKVTGDTSWRFHSSQEMPGDGFISAASEILKNASIDQIWVADLGVNSVSHLLGIEIGSNKLVKINLESFTSIDYLIDLYDSGALVPGVHYAVNDFQTKHLIEGSETIHTGIYETLIFKAVSSSQFAKQVYSAQFKNDYIEFDIDDRLCEDGITARKGFITFRRDDKGNEAYCDIRNHVFYRQKLIASVWDNATTYYKGDLVSVSDVIMKANFDSPEVGIDPVIIDGETGELTVSEGWTTFLDCRNFAYLYAAEETEIDQSGRIGFINLTGLSYSAVKKFHIFSNTDGDFDNSLCRNIKIGSNISPANIVFVNDSVNEQHDIKIHDNCSKITFYGIAHNIDIGKGSVNNIIINSNDVFICKTTESIINYAGGLTISGYPSKGNVYNYCITVQFTSENVYNNIQSLTNSVLGSDFWDNSVVAMAYCATNGAFSHNIIGDLQLSSFANQVYNSKIPSGSRGCTFNGPISDVTFPVIKYLIFEASCGNPLDCTPHSVILGNDYTKKIIQHGTNGRHYVQYFNGTTFVNTIIAI